MVRPLNARGLLSLNPLLAPDSVIQRPRSAAISLCWVACGRLDAFYEADLEPWDFAAGSLIALEAGADVQGAERDLAEHHLIIASAPTVTAGLRQLLREQPWESSSHFSTQRRL